MRTESYWVDKSGPLAFSVIIPNTNEKRENTDSKFEFFRPSHYCVSFLSTVEVLAAVMINIFVTWRLHGNNSSDLRVSMNDGDCVFH